MFFLRRLSLHLALAGFVGIGLLLHTLRSSVDPAASAPAGATVAAPDADRIAGNGLVEARGENISVAAPEAGLVVEVTARVGAAVRAGEPLFRLESAELAAEAAAATARVEAARATLSRTEGELARSRALNERGAAPDADTERLALQAGEARAFLIVAEREVAVRAARLERRTVRAPADGVVLRVDVLPGEYVAPAAATPALLLGDLERLRVRVEVDEQFAPLIRAGAGAVAFARGFPDRPVALVFVRVEPALVPKRNLAGDAAERIDTRVLPVVFELTGPPPLPLYVGQRLDVFIER